MMRTDINLAIVAMVEEPDKATTNTTQEYCFVIDDSNSNSTSSLDYGGTLKWSAQVQSYILASFYWAYIVSQVVGGLATQKLGTKRVFGYAQLVTALCSLTIPWASETHYAFVIALRFAQGFASGLTWPAMYALVGHWIPVPERSRFMSSFQGNAPPTAPSHASTRMFRFQHRHRHHLPPVRLPHSPPGLEVGLLHDGVHRGGVVRDLVLVGVRQPRDASEDQPQRTAVHQREHRQHVRGFAQAGRAVEGYLDLSTRLVHRGHHVREDLGALHLHHTGA
jgi:hypothetical protein